MNRKLVIAAVLVAVVAVAAAKSMQNRPSDKQGSASEIRRSKPAWVLIHSTMCIPCREMDKTAKAVMPAFEGRVQFVDVIIDRPRDAELVKRFKVDLIPTSVFLDSSGREISREVGAIKQDKLKARLDKLAGGR